MDANFKQLEERLDMLEKGPLMAEGIKAIRQDGDQLIIESTEGRMFGPFHLPKYLPTVRGKWLAGVKYTWGDWVNYNKFLYFCIKNHTSETFQSEHWQELFVMESTC